MGIRFRKSFGNKFFRTTVSKSGISFSTGIPGLRLTKKANGKIATTLGIPTTGISYTKEHNIAYNKNNQKKIQNNKEVIKKDEIDNWYDLISFSTLDEKTLFLLGYFSGLMNKYKENTEHIVSVEGICIPFKVVDVNNCAAKMGLGRNYTSSHLSKMVEKGWFVREERGVYKINKEAIIPYVKTYNEYLTDKKELEELEQMVKLEKEKEKEIKTYEQFVNKQNNTNISCNTRKILAILSAISALGLFGIPSLLCKQYKWFGISWLIVFILASMPADSGMGIAIIICGIIIPIYSIKNIK